MPAADPRRFESLLRSQAQSPHAMPDLGYRSVTDQSPLIRGPGDDKTSLRMLAASLSDDDAMAIVGPRPNPHGGAYLPSAAEWRMMAAKRLLASGYQHASPDTPRALGAGFSRLLRGRAF